MAWLIGDLHLSRTTGGDDRRDFLDSSVQKIQCHALNLQPASSIDPRSPFAKIGDHVAAMGIIEFHRQLPECIEIERVACPIVQTPINVGLWSMGSTGA